MFSFFSKPQPHLILLIGDEGSVCALHNMPGAVPPFFAAPGESEKTGAILSLAARNPKLRVTLLADNLAQDFRREALPRLNPFDRLKLIRRRLQQAFPQARLAASLKVRSDRGQVLLASLHGGAVFDCLNRMAGVRPGNPPVIGMLPVEGAALVAQLLPVAEESWGLLISRQRTGGFRQIVTHRGELVFSRLTPSLPLQTKPGEIAASIARDIQATRDYLSRLGLADDLPLHTVLLAAADLQPELRRVLPAATLLITPREAALHLELSFVPAAGDPYGDLLFAGWLARKKRLSLMLMPPDLRQTRRTAFIRRWGLRTAIACCLIAFGIAALEAGDLFTTLMAREKEATQLNRLEKQFAQERATAAPVTEPLGRLRQALERQRLFSAPAASPWLGLSLLNTGLGDGARLVKLDWQDGSGKPEDEVIRADARLAAPPDMNDREATVGHFEHMAQTIARAMPGYAVTVVRYPFPALPREALSNKAPTDKKVLNGAAAEFEIKKAVP